MTSQQPVRFSTVAEAATALGVSVRTVQRRIAAGDLQADRDEAGRVRVRLEPDGPPPEPEGREAALVVRDTLTGVLDRYRASIDRLERTRFRWLGVGVAGLTLGVASVAFVSVVSFSFLNRDRQVTASAVALADANAALVDALKDLAAARVALAEASTLTATMSQAIRHADDRASAVEAECVRLTVERDALADELTDLRTEFVLGRMTDATR